MSPWHDGRLLGRCVGFLALALAVTGCAAATPGAPTAMPVPARVLAVDTRAPETIELAERAWAEGRLADARVLLDRVMQADPLDPRARYLAAELALAQGATRHAVEAFARLTDDPTVGAAASQGLGIAALKLGEDRAAFTSLRRAVDADSELWRAWSALGTYYDRRHVWDLAKASYARALQANPDAFEVHNNLGFSLLMQGRLAEAQDRFERALRLDPGSVLVRENLRLVLARRGEYAQALSGVAPADRAQALNNVGYVALLRGDYAGAEAYLLRAMEIDPRYNEVASRNLSYLEGVRAMATATPPGTGR